ncbi:MAG: hypothetical protein OEY55_02600 [Acidimicrobiia bacterium]|nr:hypothetical protein [Acidimicrobiia bacterium]MDH5420678.1 hypothetical protein [Acidimicrobiia bacterium]MDH5502459.1 hypothetical protein [Acidimicrobiia bacterium]
MVIDSVTLYTVGMTLRDPFVTATDAQPTRTLLLVSITSGNFVGWAECSADGSTYCRGESAETARLALGQVAPALLGSPVVEPQSNRELVPSPMAATALEGARWDLYAKSNRLPLAIALKGKLDGVPSRAVLGRSDHLLDRAEQAIEQGYRSLKIKLTPSDDLAGLRSVRAGYPDVGIAVDFNGSASHGPEYPSYWDQLDDLDLEFIEQPFQPADHLLSEQLLKRSRTPICLDESVRDRHQAARAANQGFLINLKAAKFGGAVEARTIWRDLPAGQGWWGGMLETGIGRAHSVALATLPGATLASDLAASDRYYTEDLTEPFTLSEGRITPADRPGIGVEVDLAVLDRLNTRPPDRFL